MSLQHWRQACEDIVSVGSICTPHTSICPSIAPYTPVCPPYHMFPCHGDLGGIFTPHLSWGLWGASVHLSGIPVSVCTSIFLSIHKSYQLLPIIVGCFLTGLDAYVCLLCVMLLFLTLWCLIMPQASTTTGMTTTLPVTGVCSGMSSLLSVVTMAPCLMGLSATSGWHDVVMQPPLTPRHSEGDVGLATVP